MAAKRSAAPRRRAPAAPKSSGLSVERLSAYIGLFLAVCSAASIGYSFLRDGWQKDATAQKTSEEVAKGDKKLADAKLEFGEKLAAVVKEMTEKQATLAKEAAETKAQVGNIDASGTRYGRDQYAPMNVERQQTKKDVEDLKSLLAEIVPSLADIKANVRWLMANAGAPDAVSAARANPHAHHPRTRIFPRPGNLATHRPHGS